MSEAARRPLDSLFLQVEYEPLQFQLVVEGYKDRVLYNAIFRAHHIADARAIEVDRLDVPRTIFAGEVVEGGNRARVVRIGELAAERFPDGDAGIACLADLDVEALFPVPRSSPYLALTSGTSSEALYFDPQVMACVLDRFFGLDVDDAAAVLESILDVCREVFLARAVDAHLGLQGGALDPLGDTSVEDARLVLDVTRYHERYCRREGLTSHEARYLAEVADLRSRALGLQLANGHDFVAALRHLVISLGAPRNMATIQLIHRALMTCLKLEGVATDPTVAEILRRASSRGS